MISVHTPIIIITGYNDVACTEHLYLKAAKETNTMNRLPPRTQEAVIEAGATKSNLVDIDQYSVVALKMPDEWTDANLRLRAATERGGETCPVYDDAGIAITIVAGAGRIIILDYSLLPIAGLKYVQFESTVAQDDDRTITLFMKR